MSAGDSTPNRRELIFLGAILGASLILASLVVGWVIYHVKTFDSSVITVTGVAQKEIKSDIVKWRSSFSLQTGPTSADLMRGSATMRSDLAEILAYVTAHGVSGSEVTVLPLSVSATYQSSNGSVGDRSSGRLAGYRLSQELLIESDKVDAITKLARDASQFFVGKGIVFSGQDPAYYLKNRTLDASRQQLLAEALADAKRRAEAITQGVGASVGALRSSTIGVTQITPVYSTEISNYGAYDTTTIEKLITYLVRATFTMR